ncbi:MFS transporter [Nocardia panacis]|uniref:MFS transporter n=1 Tax=Nocardia panacis TaxID=2340916 RepID=UPI0013151F2F|nr:MFS transporter [Nocardia panacis]
MTDAYNPADYHRLFVSYTVSLFGSLLASGVVAWIAMTRVHVHGTSMGLLLGAASATAAVVAFTVGSKVDRWRKRLVLLRLDILCAVAVLSLAIAMRVGHMSLLHLWLVDSIELSSAILVTSATAPLLKVVAADRLDWANGRQEAVFWTAQLAGPPLGGFITSAIGPEWTLLGNSLSFCLSAVSIAQIRTACEPSSPPKSSNSVMVLLGLKTIWANRPLQLLYINAQLFGVPQLAISPVLALFLVQELGLSAWQYGLVLGLPCAGGVLAGLLTRRILNSVPRKWLLKTAGVGRCLWLLPIAAVPAGPHVMLSVLCLETATVFSAGIFNPAFATTRIRIAPADRLSAVVSSWGASTRMFQPVGTFAGGALMDVIGARSVFAIAGILCLMSMIPLMMIKNDEIDTIDTPHVVTKGTPT